MGVDFSQAIINSYNLGVDWSFFENLAENKTVCYNNLSWMHQFLNEVGIVWTYDWWHLSSLAGAIFANRMEEIRLYSEEFQKLIDEKAKLYSEEFQKLFDKETKESIVMMLKKKYPLNDITEIFSVTRDYVYKLAKDNNLQVNDTEE